MSEGNTCKAEPKLEVLFLVAKCLKQIQFL